MSGLGHTLFDKEPAIIACEPFGLDVLAAGLELALVLTPVGAHFFQALLRHFEL